MCKEQAIRKKRRDNKDEPGDEDSLFSLCSQEKENSVWQVGTEVWKEGNKSLMQYFMVQFQFLAFNFFFLIF
jgi:hypothetical protein